jgi:hypothetical protein
MSAIKDLPSNPNFLSPLNFTFKVRRAPHLNFFIQEAKIPGIAIQPTMIANPLIRVPYSGDHIDYDPLVISYKVDEDLQNYLEIYNWLVGLGTPESLQQYADLEAQPSMLGGGIKSDLDLVILSSSKNPNYSITYVDAFPISIDGLSFDTTRTDVDYISTTVTFKYTSYKINKLY